MRGHHSWLSSFASTHGCMGSPQASESTRGVWMLSWTQSPGQAQPGVLGHPAAGCLPAHTRQGWDMEDAGLVLTAASPLVFRAWTHLAAAHSGGQKRLEIAGKEGPQAGDLMWRCCTFCQPAALDLHPRACPGLCPPAESGCPIPCEWGETSSALLAAEAESLTCYMSCVTIAAALVVQLLVMLAAVGLSACLTPHFGRDVPPLMPWDRTPPSPSNGGVLSTAALGVFI